MYDIETLYQSGKMPLWIYSQLNNKTPQENYNLFKKQQQEKHKKELSPKAKEELAAAVEKALDEILQGLNQ